jgi:ribosomal protein S18 acetylase RimI-like enzyme
MLLLRPAQPRDALAVARIHVRAWQAAYRGLLPDRYLDALRAEDRARRYTFDPAAITDPARPETIVAERADALLGFATTAPAAGLPGTGELAALHVDPDAWRCGVGSALIAQARARLVERGCAAAVLWVMVGNTRAEQFYRADGWQLEGTRQTVEVWGTAVDELRYHRPLP